MLIMLGLPRLFTNRDAIGDLLARGTLAFIDTSGGWSSTTVVGTGGGSTGFGVIESSTGTTASSSSVRSASLYNLDSGSGSLARINWNKQLRLWFRFIRQTSEAQSIARVQLKEATTIGALAALGIGIQVDNLAVSLESYGTSVATVSASTTLTTAVGVEVEIRHYPASRIELYINNALKCSQTTAAKIPSGNAGAGSALATSIANGVSGGTSAISDVGWIWIWQAF